ncbi:MAG: hypothetical protein K1W18_07235 [Oscillospiraceae bacterium]
MANMTVDETLEEIKRQFENNENCTECGDPQAWIYLDNGRSLEVVYEQEMLPPEEYFFSVRLHCSDDEFDNFYSSVGVIECCCTGAVSNPICTYTLRDAINSLLKVNQKERR